MKPMIALTCGVWYRFKGLPLVLYKTGRVNKEPIPPKVPLKSSDGDANLLLSYV